MIRAEAEAKMMAHNSRIEHFMEAELPALLGVKDKDSRVSIYKWFEAQRIYEAQGFYKAGKAVQDELRADGWDVKMDMQSYKLVW